MRVTGQRRDGWSTGVRIDNGKRGLFPSLKVEQQIVVADYPTFLYNYSDVITLSYVILVMSSWHYKNECSVLTTNRSNSLVGLVSWHLMLGVKTLR